VDRGVEGLGVTRRREQWLAAGKRSNGHGEEMKFYTMRNGAEEGCTEDPQTFTERLHQGPQALQESCTKGPQALTGRLHRGSADFYFYKKGALKFYVHKR
jgi:hypothetical protein